MTFAPMSVTRFADKSTANDITRQLVLLLTCQAAADVGVKLCVCVEGRGRGLMSGG